LLVPGSHKANFTCPEEVALYMQDKEAVEVVEADAGDVIIFLEATIHGSVPYTGAPPRQRRSLIYRYVPYYMDDGHNTVRGWETVQPPPLPQWAEHLSPTQLSALRPKGESPSEEVYGGMIADGTDARLMGWRPRHTAELEADLAHGTRGANGRQVRPRL
jgi:hypothetical protein